jgi:Zn-dependent alcohol dehydrogenase
MAYVIIAIIATKPGGTDVLHKVDIDLPVPSATDVLIRQTAVGVNLIDVYFRTGLYPWPTEKDLILGSEGAGTVEAVGPQVSGFSIGEAERQLYDLMENEGLACFQALTRVVGEITPTLGGDREIEIL